MPVSGPLDAKEVSRCIAERGGRKWTQAPRFPARFPAHYESVVMIGPKIGHITVYLSRRPEFTKHLARGFDEIEEFKATVVRGGHGLLLLDADVADIDRRVAFECVEG